MPDRPAKPPMDHLATVDDDSDSDSALIRTLGVVLTPFVLGAEATGRVVIGFFSVAEKLNPGPLLQRALKPLADLSLRFMRTLRNPLRPIEKAVDRLLRAVGRLASPMTSAVANIADRVRESIIGFGRSILRATESFRTQIARTWRGLLTSWRNATSPIRNAGDRLQHRLRTVRLGLRRARERRK